MTTKLVYYRHRKDHHKNGIVFSLTNLTVCAKKKSEAIPEVTDEEDLADATKILTKLE